MTKPDDKLLLKAGLAEVAAGRPYLMPPNVQADRVAMMRKAVLTTFADAGFPRRYQTHESGRHLAADGDQLQKLIEETYRTPPEIVRRLRQLSLH